MNNSTEKKRPHKGVLWQEKAMRDNRGRLTDKGYTPFIRLHRKDFSSRGTSAWQFLQNTGRQHDLLSVLEKQVGIKLAHLGAVDMWEQYRLSLTHEDVDFSGGWRLPQGTEEICARRGIKHPRYTSSNQRYMTTDWVVSSKSRRHFAVFVKYKKDVPVRGKRDHDLALVQNEYWQSRGIPMCIATEECVDKALLIDLMWANEGGRQHPNGAPEQFLGFLKQINQERGLSAELLHWGGSERAMDALLLFKAAVHAGQIELLPTRLNPLHLPRLSDPRPFKLIAPTKIDFRLERFLNRLEKFHE